MEIADFYDELPQLKYTWQEWIEFVEKHPEYLTINRPAPLTVQAVTLAISYGLENITELMSPLASLKNKDL